MEGNAGKGEGEMNSVVLAQLVASAVMAGELSLMAAQVSGDLVSAHEKLGHILGRKRSGVLDEKGRHCVFVWNRSDEVE